MIELLELTKEYNCGNMQVNALTNVNISINRGEFITIMGPSGSGKSTLLHMLGLLDAATKGVYKLEGQLVNELGGRDIALVRNRHIGFIFQSFNLLPELTALENVMLPMIYKKISIKDKKKKAFAMLEKFGLEYRARHYPNMMSGGEQQRVAIARALINDPSFILADEPTGNLPSNMSAEILKLLYDLNNEGVTIIMVTHDPKLSKCGKREIIINDGIITSDNLNKNQLNPEDLFIKDLS